MCTSLSILVINFVTLLVSNNGFIFQATPVSHSNNLDEGDSEDLSIDLDITEDDYEIEDIEETEEITKNNKAMKETKKTTKSSKLSGDRHRTANKGNKGLKAHLSDAKGVGYKGSKAKNIDAETDNSAAIPAVTTLPYFFTIKKKREISVGSEEDTTCQQYEKEISSPNNLKCPIPNWELVKNHSEPDFNILDSIKEYLSCDNCSSEDAKGIGFRAIRCLLADYAQNRQSYDVLAVRLWNIVMIWLVVYLVIAIPLWCTKGWCCCCLYCKFFKPQETIQEAKNYLLLNPPGVLITKKGAIINYEPTEREKDCYEEFGHFIRTL